MQHGFKRIALDLIRENPGQRPQVYAGTALRGGLARSDAKDQVHSLATTLMKEVREGRMPEVEAGKVNGLLVYFPRNTAPKANASQIRESQASPSAQNVAISIVLPSDIVETVDVLVKVGKFGSRSEAVGWLVGEGIEARRVYLQKAREVYSEMGEKFSEIERLKKSLVE